MNKRLTLILISMAFVAAGCNTNNPPATVKTGKVKIAGHEVVVQIADTVEIQNKGLGARASLAENDGMLFIFSTTDKHTFWMKDMLIPLDFIWISRGKVTQITPNVPIEPNIADGELNRYTPDSAVDSVLEVNAGWATQKAIKIGDSVIVD